MVRSIFAGIAQLAEHWPSKPDVAGSNPVSRSGVEIWGHLRFESDSPNAHKGENGPYPITQEGEMAKDIAREVGSFIERLRIEAGVATVCGGKPTRESLLALKEDLNQIVSAGNVALHEVEENLLYYDK